MPLPAVLNLVDIVINQRDTAQTFVDSDFGQPVGAEERLSAITLQGQANWHYGGRTERLSRTLTGDAADSSGHVVFRTTDLDDASPTVTLSKGDRITSIAGYSHDLEIVEVRRQAFLRGAPLLTMCFFTDIASKRASR